MRTVNTHFLLREFFLCLTSILILCSCAPIEPVVMAPIYSIKAEAKPSAWWQKRHKDKIEEAKASKVDLLMLGDSITHFWENKGLSVWNEYYQSRNAFNLGFSADRTENVLWRIQNGALDNMNPKLTVLMIGTNNTGHRMDPAAHTAEGVKAIVSELRSKLPNSKILLLGIFPRHSLASNEMRIRNDEINQLISVLANNETIFYLNINDAFLDENQVLKPELMPDLLHPNNAGYRVWAEKMEKQLNTLLN